MLNTQSLHIGLIINKRSTFALSRK